MSELTTEARLALAVRAQVAAIRADRAVERGGYITWEALRQEAVEEMRALAAAWQGEGGTLLEWVGVDRETYMRAVENALDEDG
jgi:hypothetical protein